MNGRITEDSRPLRDFYPEPGLRHQVHYAFGHRFLPEYVHQDPRRFFSYLFCRDLPGGPMDPTRFIHSRWSVIFEPAVGLTPPLGHPAETVTLLRRVTDLDMSIHELGGKPVALVQMPKPDQTAEAIYVAAVLLASPPDPSRWPADAQARIFTLERMDSSSQDRTGKGVVCEWTRDRQHRNFGRVVEADRNSFLGFLRAVLDTPETPAQATFTPARDGQPGVIRQQVTATPPPLPPEATKPWWKFW